MNVWSFRLVAVVVFGVACPSLVQARELTTMSRRVEDYFDDAGVRALADAAARGKVDEVDRLIASGVPVDGLGRDRWTPLAWALDNLNRKGVKALLRHGADPNHRIRELGFVSDMPVVMLIAGVRIPELLEAMLEAGACPNARYGVPAGEGDPAEYPYEGESLLIKSLIDPVLVRVLLEHSADVNPCVHGRGMTLAHTAAERAADTGNFDALELLLASGANERLDAVAARLQTRTWSPSAEPRRVELLRELKKRGAKVHPSETNPQTPKELLSPGNWEWPECESDTPVDVSGAKSQRE